MVNSIFLFRLYVLAFLLFLIPLSFFTTVQLLSLIRMILKYNIFFNDFSHNFQVLDVLSFKDIFNFHANRKQWFLCVSLIDLSFHYSNLDTDLLYISLAYSYKTNSFLSIAEYYYLKALSISPSNIVALKSLAIIYDQLGKREKALSLYDKISSLHLK
uniref:Uncharacterized protein n=1 Tax=Osmundaria fimbriata TaxID=228265 RepID=A0A1Z1M4M5_OSMFI|nr:hypothetical protein [Osmundaria fimbriata]ARW60724.1 hypothetical protein [Osmundaria fimbriata]